MDKLLLGDKVYNPYEYTTEDEFEKEIVKNSNYIFGENSVYFDIKKRIGQDNILTIPDGYLIDLTFDTNPKLYIIENELVSHAPYKHIGQQLLRFAISYKISGRKVKGFLLDEILKDNNKKDKIEKFIANGKYRNIDDFLDKIILDKPVSAIVIIDERTSELESVLGQLTMQTDILEFKTYVNEEEKIHRFMPFHQDIIIEPESTDEQVDIDDLDTIVVPANEEGFNEVFLGQNCWYSIRISSAMIDRIKYIAGYQTAPVSAITYYAEVSHIEKYEDTNKYIVHFKESAKKIGPIKLDDQSKNKVPYAPRYTTYNKLINAKTLKDVL